MSHLDAILTHSVPAPIILSDGSTIDPSLRPHIVTEDDVIRLLQRDNFVSVAVVILYARQCADERIGAFTRHDNGVGFNAFDARQGTYWGEWVTGQSVRFPDRMPSFKLGGQRLFLLSGKHLHNARHMLHKYRKQLAQAINAM